MRHCTHCTKEISLETMARGRWRAIFCSPACHMADRTKMRRLKAEWRKQRGCCPTCGKRSSGGKCASAIGYAVPTHAEAEMLSTFQPQLTTNPKP